MRRPTLSVLAVVLSTACGPSVDPKALEPLNQELTTKTLDQAVADRDHFSPLCDENGYPLVGNIASKGGATASEFCAAQHQSGK